MIEKIKKRDGREIPFSADKITRAIFLAASAVAKKDLMDADYETSEQLSEKVVSYLNKKFHNEVPGVEDVQDAVIRVLIENNHVKTSEAYILYRNERSRIRNAKTRLMKEITQITYEDYNSENKAYSISEKMYRYTSAVSREFALNSLLKSDYGAIHNEGIININELDYLSLGSTESIFIDLTQLFNGGFSIKDTYLREPQDIESYSALCCMVIAECSKDLHYEIALPYFDYDMAAGVKKTFRKKYIIELANIIEIKYEKKLKLKNEIRQAERLSRHELRISFNHKLKEYLSEIIAENIGISEEEADKIIDRAYQVSLKDTKAKTYQAMEALIHNLNSIHANNGGLNKVSVNVGMALSEEGRLVTSSLLLAHKNGLGNNESSINPQIIFKIKKGINLKEKDPNHDLLQLAIEVNTYRKHIKYIFNDYYEYIRNYDRSDYHYEVSSSTRNSIVMSNVNGVQNAKGRGVLSSLTINLAHLALKYDDRNNFMQSLSDIADIALSILKERYIIQSNKRVNQFPVLMGQGLYENSEDLEYDDNLAHVLKHGNLVIDYIGLKQVKTILKTDLEVEIVSLLRKKCDEKSRKESLNYVLGLNNDFELRKYLKNKDNKYFGLNDNSEAYPFDYLSNCLDDKDIELLSYHNGGYLYQIALHNPKYDDIKHIIDEAYLIQVGVIEIIEE